MLTLLLGACATGPTSEGVFELVWIEAPTFCQGEVRSYSDFAYIRPSNETVIGNRCAESEDSLGDGPVLWVAVPGYDGWQPPADREQRLRYEQRFKRGSALVPSSHEGLARLLEVAKAHPDRPIRIVGNTAKGEKDDIARRRALAVKNWLAKNGVPASRLTLGPSGHQGASAESEITIIVRG
ncbi:MAG: OmpA family protein [Sulfuritalea sp.]|nr:OmpA family protein [Sulfuritalea sp.]